MRLFGRLFRKKPLVEAHDPVFGRITFEHGLWTFIPAPHAEGFMIAVDAPESGPSQSQREFFQAVRANLSAFEQRAREFIRSRADSSVDACALAVYSVEVGSDDEVKQARFVLEMSDAAAVVVHRVSFVGDEPVSYGYDD